MAYARFGVSSDVYMFHNMDGRFQCYGPSDEYFETPDAQVMLTHLQVLENQGHRMGTAIARLAGEIEDGKWDEDN